MQIRRASFALLILVTLAATSALAADIRWRPEKTWVLIVGTLEWEDADAFESFPKENRRDAELARFFRQKGIAPNHLVSLADAQATRSRAQAALVKILSQTSEGDLLFFYFTGHGYQSDDEKETFFATYDASDDQPGWSVDLIVRTIARNFRGRQIILAADCCYSGALVDGVKRLGGAKSYACFASSTSKESSTANWTFTEMLLAGLRGQVFADLDGDGQVTLGEIARGVHDDMLFADEQTSASIFTGDLDRQTPIATAPRKRDRAIGRRVEVFTDGDWFKARIIDVRNRQYRVHYYGYEGSDDEWVDPEDVR